MPNQIQIGELIHNAGGVITSKQVTEAGFHRSVLSGLVQTGELERVARGVYAEPDAWEDEMYLLQYRYRKGIYSHETALYLHGFSDRTPAWFTMTFPWGYNAASLKNEKLKRKKAIKEIYELGITEMVSPAGNMIRVYDLERTLCDIVRGNNRYDIQIVLPAMRQYAESRDKDIHKLTEYAKKLRVFPIIHNYMEILL